MEGGGNDYSVAIVDDDPVVRRAMGLYVEHIGGFRVSAAFDSGNRALDALVHAPPDVLLLDLRMPGLSGLECARLLTDKVPQLRIVIVTASSNASDFQASLALGLHGYLLKPATIDSVRLVLVAAIAGLYVAPHGLNRAHRLMPGTSRPPVELSHTERRIMDFIRLGYKDTHIAGELAISVNTLRTHLKRLFRKLGAHSRAEAITQSDQRAGPIG